MFVWATILCVLFVWAGREIQSDGIDKLIDSLRHATSSEIASLAGHEWGGEYYQGDGLGANLSLLLAPKSGFVFQWHGCLGLYAQNYGPVEATNGKIKLKCTLPNGRKGAPRIAEELILVSWGARKYLIPPDQIIKFCNEVNVGREPRAGLHGRHFLRRGDEKKAVTGLPTVPEEFNAYLLSRPIDAYITEVPKQTAKVGTVILNRGRKDGVLPGMELHIIEPEMFEWFEVTKVEEETSEAVMVRVLGDEPAPRRQLFAARRHACRERNNDRVSASRGPTSFCSPATHVSLDEKNTDPARGPLVPQPHK